MKMKMMARRRIKQHRAARARAATALFLLTLLNLSIIVSGKKDEVEQNQAKAKDQAATKTAPPSPSPTLSPSFPPPTYSPTYSHAPSISFNPTAPTASPTTFPTLSPTTAAPITNSPTSAAPTSAAPTSAAPTSASPTDEPTTAPTSAAPTSEAPTTTQPTDEPTTSNPTSSPTTSSPTRLGNCDSPSKSKQECFASLFCTWSKQLQACTYPTSQPTLRPNTDSPTIAPITPIPTRAPITQLPTPSPTTLHPIWSVLEPSVQTNCYLENLSKEECKAAVDCEWIKSEVSGDNYCEFVEGSITSVFSTSSVVNTSPTPFPTDDGFIITPEAVENCYLLSLNEESCTTALNCEWVLDGIGNTYCKDKPIIAESCYVLSMSSAQCTSAINCEYVLDGNLNPVCQPNSRPSGSDTTTTPIPTDPSTFGSILISDPTLSGAFDCSDPNLEKQECRDSIYCTWDRPGNKCIDATQTPTLSPIELPPTTPTSNNNNTPFPTDPATLGMVINTDPTPNPTQSNFPTQSLQIDCLDPNLSKQDCRDSPDCEWDKNECIAITQTPTSSPINPTPVPTTSNPTPSPTLSPENPTQSPTTSNPTPFPITPQPTPFPTVPPTPSPITLEPTPFPMTPQPTPFPTTNQPTKIGRVDCDTPNISRNECNDAPNCEWMQDDDGKNGCAFGTWPPTEGPSPGPSERPITPSPVTGQPATSEPTTKVPTLRPTTLPPTPPPTIKPTLDPVTFDILDGTGQEILLDESEDFKQQIVDCLDPNISKTDCQAAANCAWDKKLFFCSVVTASPTTERPTGRPSDAPTVSSAPTTRPPTRSPSEYPSASPTGLPSSSPTVSSEPTVIPSDIPTISTSPTVSTEPTNLPTISHYPTMADYEYLRPKRNDLRFVPWNKLERKYQLIAQEELRYTKETWDNLGSNAIEQLRWDDLGDAQKEAAVELGFVDEVSWNCWQNHWESFSWKQLYTLKLTPYIQSLGWDMTSWNRQYRDQPMKRKGKWDSLDSDQRWNAANQLCHYKTSYDRLDISEYGLGYPMAKPSKRFVPWEDVDDKLRVQLEQNMGYTELTWNVLRLADIEQKGWFEFMYFEKDTATEFGFDDASWDCWQNHYDSYGWNDLVKKGHHVHYVGLGWSETSWDEAIDPPVSEQNSWKELSEVEQLHATELCYDESNWDRIDMTRNTGPFPFPKPKLRYTVWNRLSEEDQRHANAVLLYEEQTWNDVGRADIEKRAWDDLTEYQKPYAIKLGLYHRTWDCFQNHYRATKWNKLSEDTQSAAITLGWDEDSWNRFLGQPDSYKKKWDQLRDEEAKAAFRMCYFDITWPGDGFSVNLLNQYGGSDLVMNGASQIAASMVLPVFFVIVMQ